MKKPRQHKILKQILIVIDILGLAILFIAYGPFSFFRDWLVTTALGTNTHQYFAYILYSDAMVEKVIENNRVIDPMENTDASKIEIGKAEDVGSYSSVYEEEILKRNPGNDLYKIINLSGPGYKGYMAVVYDPARVELVFSSRYGHGGEFLSTMAKANGAILAINASGTNSTPGSNRVTGVVIKDGKIYDRGRELGSTKRGLIGFTKDNVLVLTRDTPEKAIQAGLDRAVQFGPFLVVNGKPVEMRGNGGWGIANRSAIGQRKDGIVLLVVIDGRTVTSPGISLRDLRDLLVKYGAYNASNLDGGGSSGFYGNGRLLSHPQGFNYDGERYLPNAWMVLPQF